MLAQKPTNNLLIFFLYPNEEISEIKRNNTVFFLSKMIEQVNIVLNLSLLPSTAKFIGLKDLEPIRVMDIEKFTERRIGELGDKIIMQGEVRYPKKIKKTILPKMIIEHEDDKREIINLNPLIIDARNFLENLIKSNLVKVIKDVMKIDNQLGILFLIGFEDKLFKEAGTDKAEIIIESGGTVNDSEFSKIREKREISREEKIAEIMLPLNIISQSYGDFLEQRPIITDILLEEKISSHSLVTHRFNDAFTDLTIGRLQARILSGDKVVGRIITEIHNHLLFCQGIQEENLSIYIYFRDIRRKLEIIVDEKEFLGAIRNICNRAEYFLSSEEISGIISKGDLSSLRDQKLILEPPRSYHLEIRLTIDPSKLSANYNLFEIDLEAFKIYLGSEKAKLQSIISPIKPKILIIRPSLEITLKEILESENIEFRLEDIRTLIELLKKIVKKFLTKNSG